MDEVLKVVPGYRVASPSERAKLVLRSLVVADGELDIEASYEALVELFGGAEAVN